MTVSYKKLWHRLVDNEMNKTELQKRSGITWAALSKLTKNESVNLDVLVKICHVFNCQIEDLVELVPTTNNEDKNA